MGNPCPVVLVRHAIFGNVANGLFGGLIVVNDDRFGHVSAARLAAIETERNGVIDLFAVAEVQPSFD